ncbi:MAG: ribose 5-phosphate isomerase B [Firmicutes bacterium]|nr:ribose 5-phosphate isomerase B [Bacillota bacterium]
MKVAVGADHAGFALKESVKAWLGEMGHEVLDFGTHSEASCDYPDFAREVALAVAQGRAERGVLVCGSGIGMAIAANKVPGVRAAPCNDVYSATVTRADNDANVLTMGARIVGPGLARAIVEAFFRTPFAGGRHQRRVDKIRKMETDSLSAAPGPARDAQDAPAAMPAALPEAPQA